MDSCQLLAGTRTDVHSRRTSILQYIHNGYTEERDRQREEEKEGLEEHPDTNNQKREALWSLIDEEYGLGFQHSNFRFSEDQLTSLSAFEIP